MTDHSTAGSPVAVLRSAIDSALARLQTVDPTVGPTTEFPPLRQLGEPEVVPVAEVDETVNAVLGDFTTAVGPVFAQLNADAATAPGGPLDAAMAAMRTAFTHLGNGDVSPACTAMANARTELAGLD